MKPYNNKTGSIARAGRFLSGFLLTALLGTAGLAQQAQPGQKVQKAPSPRPSGAPAAKAQQPPAPKAVIKVGSKGLTEADLTYLVSILPQQAQQQVASQGRKAVGDNYAMALVLAQQAVRDHLDVNAALERQVELDRMQKLAQAEYEKLAKDVQVSAEEITAYYQGHQQDFLEFQARRIMVRAKAADAAPGSSGLEAKDAKARIDAIRQGLLANKDAKEVNKEFKSTTEGFMDVEPRPFRLSQFPPEWQKAITSVKDGQFTEPFDMPWGLGMIQVISRKQLEVKDVQSEIDSGIRMQKLQQVMNDLKSKANVWMDDAYFNPPTPPSPPPEQKPATAPATPKTANDKPAANNPAGTKPPSQP